MTLLCLIVLAGWGIRQRLNAKRERERRIAAEQKYMAAVAELERQAFEYRRHFSSDIDLHVH